MEVTKEWCGELAMHREACLGCSYFDGREVSRYQEARVA